MTTFGKVTDSTKGSIGEVKELQSPFRKQP